MFVLYGQLEDRPIISIQTGETVALLGPAIINPTDLKAVAFYCRMPKRTQAVLLSRDIRQLSPDGVIIDSLDEIEDVSEIVRLKELLDQRFQLVGLPVVNESGLRLGKVEEFAIHTDSHQVQKLYVHQSIIKNLLLNDLVIDRNQIVEVTVKEVVVRDATVKKPLLAATPVPD